jgi:hypothetical protein
LSEVINLTVKDKPADGVPRQHPDSGVDGAAKSWEANEDVIDEVPGEGIGDVHLTEALVEERTAELLENEGGQLQPPGEGLHDVHVVEREGGGEGLVEVVLILEEREARGGIAEDDAEHEANGLTHVVGGVPGVDHVEDQVVDVLGDQISHVELLGHLEDGQREIGQEADDAPEVEVHEQVNRFRDGCAPGSVGSIGVKVLVFVLSHVFLN